MLIAVPINLREANAFVAQHHRHHEEVRGCIFVVGCALSVATGLTPGVTSAVVGVAIVGRPVARGLQDGWTAEVTRVATNGTRNACSFLYRSSWRAARALGYRKLVTYTLPEEGGASLRGAGFKLIGEAGGGTWDRQERPRIDTHPTQVKLRWELTDG